MTPSLRAITTHRFIIRAALAAGNLFAWVLIFHALYYSGETGAGALISTALAYALSHLIAFTLTPLAAANLVNGTQRSILYATFALCAAYVWLAASSVGVFGSDVQNLWLGIAGFVFLSGVYRAFYFVPYKVASSVVPHPKTNYLFEIFLTLIPLSASVIISDFANGSWMLLVGCAAFAFLSSIALLRIHETYEPFLWNYSDTMHNLFSENNRDTLMASISHGVQGAALLFAWPLAIFILFDWSYQMLGTIMSVTLILTLLGKKYLPRALWIIGAGGPPVRNTLAASSWILRLLIFSPTSVVLADVLYHVSAPTRRFGFDHLAHEQAADASHYIDHDTVLKEMGMALGRIILVFALVTLALYASPIVALAGSIGLAAVASLSSFLRISRRDALRAAI